MATLSRHCGVGAAVPQRPRACLLTRGSSHFRQYVHVSRPGIRPIEPVAGRLNYAVTGDGERFLARNLFVADTGNSTVRKIELASGRVTTVVGVPGQSRIQLGPLPAQLNYPSAVAITPSGEIIIVDGRENAVLTVR